MSRGKIAGASVGTYLAVAGWLLSRSSDEQIAERAGKPGRIHHVSEQELQADPYLRALAIAVAVPAFPLTFAAFAAQRLIDVVRFVASLARSQDERLNWTI